MNSTLIHREQIDIGQIVGVLQAISSVISVFAGGLTIESNWYQSLGDKYQAQELQRQIEYLRRFLK